MANFELRIYSIPSENFDEICEEKNIHDITSLTDSEVVEIAENIGTVFTLRNFLRLPVISPEKDYVKSYFIDIDNENALPVPADQINTIITADKITSNNNENTLYIALHTNKNKEPKTKTYTILIITNNTESGSEIINKLLTIENITNVEVLEEYENKLRLAVETSLEFKYYILEDFIDSELCLDCVYIDENLEY